MNNYGGDGYGLVGKTMFNTLGQPYHVDIRVSKTKYIVEFKNTGTRVLANQSSISTGRIKDQYAPIVCGIGYKGDGPVDDSIYDIWFNILKRVTGKYDKHISDKYYTDVSIDDEWLNFQNFQRWFIENNYQRYLHVVDKDLSGRRMYGPKTSYAIPYFINTAIIYNKENNKKVLFGIASHGNGYYSELTTILREYKVFHKDSIKAFFCYVYMKEYYIKVLANQCLLKGLITVRAYDALYKYKVEIPDAVKKPDDIDEYINNLYNTNHTFKIFIKDMNELVSNKIDHIYAQRLSKANQK